MLRKFVISVVLCYKQFQLFTDLNSDEEGISIIKVILAIICL